MSRATLIFNPRAGSRRNLTRLIPAMIRELEAQGITADSVETTGPNTATALAANAVIEGAATIFACGGDGTVHEVLQGVVGTSSALGVIPMGTVNALARNLGLSPDPLRALSQLAGASVQGFRSAKSSTPQATADQNLRADTSLFSLALDPMARWSTAF